MDIYFTQAYGKLCEIIESGVCEVFRFDCEYGQIYNMFIKRPIPININDEQYYDLITPYGYGGPRIVSFNGDKEKLCEAYEKAFSQYCIENNIVSEFIRFHPRCQNELDVASVYNHQCIRKTLGTNLEKYDDPMQQEFSKGCRKNIRKAHRDGVDYRITEKPENIDSFV